MILKDVIVRADEDKVREAFLKLYPNYVKDIEEYIKVLNKLKKIEPKFTGENIIVTVDWYEPEFEEENGSYQTHGYEPGAEVFWAIGLSPWSKWLGWQADERFMMIRGDAEYIAHILWEMTYYGFTEEDVNEFAEELNIKE